MSELTLEKETTKLEKFLIKNDRRDFVDDMRGGSRESLDAKLLSLAKHREDIKNTRAKDEKLESVAKEKKELERPYNEQLKFNEKMARFVALIMRENGQE